MATLQALRRALGYALDDLTVSVVNAADANRVQVAEWTDSSVGASVTRFGGAFLYACPTVPGTAGQQRQARMAGFEPSTGYLAFDAPWAPPPPGSLLEMTALFPCLGTAAPATHYGALVARALGLMAAPRRVAIPITGTTGTMAVSTDQYPWLDRGSRILAVHEPSPDGLVRPNTHPAAADWRRPVLVGSPPLLSLEFAARFSTGASGSVTLDVLAPAWSYVRRAGGSWAESDGGPVLDDDEVAVSPADALPFLLFAAYEALANRSPGLPSGDYAGPRDDALARCRSSRFWDRTSEQPTPVGAAPQPATRAPVPSLPSTPAAMGG